MNEWIFVYAIEFQNEIPKTLYLQMIMMDFIFQKVAHHFYDDILTVGLI